MSRVIIILSKIDEQYDPYIEKRLQTSQKPLYLLPYKKLKINNTYQQSMATKEYETMNKIQRSYYKYKIKKDE